MSDTQIKGASISPTIEEREAYWRNMSCIVSERAERMRLELRAKKEALAERDALLREVMAEFKVLTSYLPNDLPNLGMTITVKAYAKLVERIERLIGRGK